MAKRFGKVRVGFTKPTLAARKAKRRAKNKVERASRKANR
jgi:hypothetical protein